MKAYNTIKYVLASILLSVCPIQLLAFDSGSTGADGAFAPTISQSVALPADGIFNYTTVNIPSGVTITYTKNTVNTPAIILAQGDVVIDGIIDISGGDGGSRMILLHHRVPRAAQAGLMVVKEVVLGQTEETGLARAVVLVEKSLAIPSVAERVLVLLSQVERQ